MDLNKIETAELVAQRQKLMTRLIQISNLMLDLQSEHNTLLNTMDTVDSEIYRRVIQHDK